MTAHIDTLRPPRPRSTVQSPLLDRPLLLAAPAAALADSIAAEWLDFRELRAPLLIMVGLGVIATAHVVTGARRDRRAIVLTVAIGMATWGAAIAGYAAIHAARGGAFSFDAVDGPQWLQALALIGAHTLLLGAPTGLIAATVLQAAARWHARPPEPPTRT